MDTKPKISVARFFSVAFFISSLKDSSDARIDHFCERFCSLAW
jgi:hypothetical protein